MSLLPIRLLNIVNTIQGHGGAALSSALCLIQQHREEKAIALGSDPFSGSYDLAPVLNSAAKTSLDPKGTLQ